MTQFSTNCALLHCCRWSSAAMWKQVSTLSHSVHSLYCCRCHNIVYEALLYILICNTASLLSFFSWHLPWYEQKSRRTNSTFVPRMESCLHSYKSQLESNIWWPLSLLLILSEPHFLHFCSWVFIEKAVNRLLVRALFTLTQSRAFMEQMRLSVNRGNGFLCSYITHSFSLILTQYSELLCLLFKNPH